MYVRVPARLVGDEVGVGQGRARDHGDGAVPREPPLRPGPLVRVPVRRHHRVPHHLPNPGPAPHGPTPTCLNPPLHAQRTSAQTKSQAYSAHRIAALAPLSLHGHTPTVEHLQGDAVAGILACRCNA